MRFERVTIAFGGQGSSKVMRPLRNVSRSITADSGRFAAARFLTLTPPIPRRLFTALCEPKTIAFAHVQIAFAVSLREPKKGCVKPSAVIKVELIGLIDNGLRVDRRAKIESSCRHAANHAGFSRVLDQF
jgi:hypothetical protein